MEDAMDGFCVTARTSSPSRVLCKIKSSRKKKMAARIKIATRIYEIEIMSLKISDPSSQCGAVKGTARAQKIFMAHSCKEMEIPNVDNSVHTGHCNK